MSRFVTLMYHNLEHDPANRYSLPVEAFEQQVAWLKAEGYAIEGFSELEARLARGAFPERYVVMTFDDGHRSNLRAAEILSRAGAQATFFLTRDFCRHNPAFLRDGEIRELASLCSVGGHGVTHAPLSRLDAAQARAELAESKAWLEDVIGSPVTTMSAPGGFINRSVMRQARDLGYTLVGNSVEWWNEPFTVNAERLVNRVAVWQGMPLSLFARVVRHDARYLRARRLRAGALELAKRALPLHLYHGLSRALYRLRQALPGRQLSC